MAVHIWPTMAEAVEHSEHHAAAPLIWDPVDHLLNRATYGATSSTRTWLAQHGPDAWYASQVAAGRTHRGYSGNAAVAALGPMLSLSPFDAQTALTKAGNTYGWTVMDQLTRVTIGLQAWSEAQLYEVLVDFWSNHLNVPNHNGAVWTTRHVFDRDVIRRNAMGSFTTMLLASAKSPAMLTYLNLTESTKVAVNENYGREVLECHTVGLPYTQSDVVNCARLLTGRTLDDNNHYVFDDYIHPTGAVKVLGFSDPNRTATDGEAAGDRLLRYLAAHPQTAKHLAYKLCVRFVGDNPPAALVDKVAAVYLDSNTQIMPMVSTILRSNTFWQSRGTKVRRPRENVLATLRALDLTPTKALDATNTLWWTTGGMGDCPLEWPAPNGYPDIAQAWRSSGSLLSMWNTHLGLAGGWWSGLSNPAKTLYGGGKPATSGAAVDDDDPDAHRHDLLGQAPRNPADLPGRTRLDRDRPVRPALDGSSPRRRHPRRPAPRSQMTKPHMTKPRVTAPTDRPHMTTPSRAEMSS